MNLETTIYSLDGNSVFDIALKFERLALQEMSKTPQYIFQGQDLNDTREAFNFKMQFDKYFSLVKEFFVKVRSGSRSLNDNIEAEIDDQFKRGIGDYASRNAQQLKATKDTFHEKMSKSTASPPDTDSQLKILQKRMNLELKQDNILDRYYRLQLIIDPVIKKTFQDNFTLFPDNEQVFLQLEGQFEDAIKNLEDSIKFEIKDRPAIRSRIDTRTAVMLTRFEGSASNILRDIQITSSNMVEDIKMKRIVLQESLKNDNRLVESIMKDNKLILEYFEDLLPIPEIKYSYEEPFLKVLDNHKIINLFVKTQM